MQRGFALLFVVFGLAVPSSSRAALAQSSSGTVPAVASPTPAVPVAATQATPAPRATGDQRPEAAKPPVAPRATGEAQPVTAPTAASDRQRPQSVNIKIELSVTDVVEAKPAQKRTIVVMTADGENAMIRHSPTNAPGVSLLNLDAHARIIEPGRVRIQFAVEYSSDVPEGSIAPPAPPPTLDERSRQVRLVQVRAKHDLIVTSGVPVVVSESNDPVMSRKVTVEIKATVMK